MLAVADAAATALQEAVAGVRPRRVRVSQVADAFAVLEVA
jgi:hypothetical protein